MPLLAPVTSAVRPSSRCERADAGRARAAELKDLIAEQGPAFVKVGQAVAIRPDLLPPAYLDELQTLLDQVAPFGSDEARALIQHCVLTAHARESQSTDSEDDGAGGAGAGGEGGAVGGCHPDSVDSEELLRAGP